MSGIALQANTRVQTPNGIHVAFATDNNYVQHLAVTIRSMLENTSAPIVAHIVCLSVQAENVERLRRTFTGSDNAKVEFYDFDVTAYSHFRVDGHISLASYTRLFLADILPADINKLVYLDSDLCVFADVADLASIDLEGAMVAAVTDYFASENDRLDLPSDYKYFNAGILLIDLEAWRNADFRATAQQYVEENNARLTYHDQDALNALLFDKVKHIDVTWNYPAMLKRRNMWPDQADQTLFSELSSKSPRIVHFTTRFKPWIYRVDIAFEREYLRYLSMTPWSDFKQPDKTLKSVVRRYVHRVTHQRAVRHFIK